MDDPPQGDGWTWVAVAYDHYCAIHEVDGLHCRGDARTWGTLPEDHPHPRTVSVANGCTCIITDDYSVACAGIRNSVAPAPALENIVRLHQTTDAACAIDVEGALTCWGDQADTYPIPPEVQAMEVHDVFTFVETVCAVSTSGDLVCWGNDRQGVVSDAPSRLR